jgi:hypothetical protein
MARRGEPIWWLSVDRCSECGQWWLVASEERINDVFLLRRLTDSVGKAAVGQDKWPIEFDRFSTLLRLYGQPRKASPDRIAARKRSRYASRIGSANQDNPFA